MVNHGFNICFDENSLAPTDQTNKHSYSFIDRDNLLHTAPSVIYR